MKTIENFLNTPIKTIFKENGYLNTKSCEPFN